MAVDIIAFILCAAVITFSGTQLSRLGDRLAALTGLSKAWIGLILMATVTSLPEVVTGYKCSNGSKGSGPCCW